MLKADHASARRILVAMCTNIAARIAGQKTATDAQRRWHARLVETERQIALTIIACDAAIAAPADETADRHAMSRRERSKHVYQAVLAGEANFRKTYEAAHGATVEERRAGWRDAYHQRVIMTEGRTPRTNKRRADMSALEWQAHKRKQQRLYKAAHRTRQPAPAPAVTPPGYGAF